MTVIGLNQRLTDPYGVISGSQLNTLDQKLSECMTSMYRQPKNGGNPFLFALAITKIHQIRVDPETAKKILEETGNVVPSIPCKTAATDGKMFFWHPEFLAKLDKNELTTVMEHECFHVVFFHSVRMIAATARIRNWALDYVVNAVIEKNHKETGRPGTLWGGNLGKPILFKDLLAHIDGKIEAFKEGEDEARIFADISLYGRSPESIYDEIMEHWEKSPRKCKKCGALSLDPKTGKPKKKGKPPFVSSDPSKHVCPDCGTELNPSEGEGDGMPGSLDGHIDSNVSKQDVQNEVMRAVETTKSMRGMVPSEIEEFIGELMKPSLKFTDIVLSDCMRKSQEAGTRNDWLRPRRRWLAAETPQYLPKRFTHKSRWLAMLDTSGSMGQKDLIFGVSQLLVLANRNTDGIIVPCDAKVYWKDAVEVKNSQDLTKAKTTGRGGTVFDDFFAQFPSELGTDFDAIIILTDGDCGNIPMNLKPRGIPVTWVLTRYHSNWKPSFGRTAPLRIEKM